MGSGGYALSGIQGQSPWSGGQGRSPLKSESNFKINWAILRCRFDYLTIWCFQLFHLSLLICYITMPLGGEANLLESCFWAGSSTFGTICGIWGLSPHAPLSSLLNRTLTSRCSCTQRKKAASLVPCTNHGTAMYTAAFKRKTVTKNWHIVNDRLLKSLSLSAFIIVCIA